VAVYPLVHTQLIPPRIKQKIRRSRLFDLGQSILRHRLTTVVAPAGSGKSVWVSSLLDEPDWPRTAWLSLDTHDTRPSFLLYHLIHAIKTVLPDFGEESLRTMNSLEDPGRDWLIAISAIVEDTSREQEIVLILDDFQIIDQDPAACGIVEHLVQHLPDNLLLVIISRNNLPLNLCREQRCDELLEIRSDQLLFSVAEAGELLALLDLGLTEEEVAGIHALTEGWAIGLRLAGMLLKQLGGDQKQALAALHRGEAGLHAHLSRELVDSLPPDISSFILDVSLLPYLEVGLCNAALQRNDSGGKLEELHACGILSQVEGETVTWRLHHLMGEYLERRTIQGRPPAYIDAIRHRAAEFLEQMGDIDRALELVSACADWDLAASLIRRHGDNYFLQNGRLDSLHDWIGCLPVSRVAGDRWILYFKGMSILHLNHDDALEILSAAADLAGARGDIRCQLRTLLPMIAVHTFANDVKKVRETAARMPVVASLLKDSWARGVVLVGALVHAAWGDHLRQGVWLSWLSGKTRLDAESKMTRLMFSSMVQYRLGHLSTARQMIEQTLADPYVRENERWAGTVYVIYAAICRLDDDHQKLTSIISELLRLGNKYNVPHQLGNAHRHQAQLWQRQGRLVEAQSEFELSRGFYLKTNNIFFAFLTDLDLLALRISSGENPRELLAESQYLLKKMQTMPGGQGLDDYALSVVGFISMEAGDLELARQMWEKAMDNCIRKGARQVLAGTRLLLAQLSLLQGDESACDDYLRRSLGAAEAAKWMNFLDWRPDTIYAMCQRALIRGISPRWASRLLRRWFPQRFYREAGQLLASTSWDVRTNATALLQDIVRETGKIAIHVNCLGGFRLFVNGIEVNKAEWRTQKAEKLFKLLLTGEGEYLKEQIIDKLWPESDSQAGDASLRMALTHIRKALGLDRYGVEGVAQRRGKVYITPELEILTDYQLFVAVARDGLRHAEAGDPRAGWVLEQAAELYRGAFLPDDPDDEWAAGRREQLHNLQIQVLLKLIDCCQDRKKPATALEACQRYLTLEPADEQISRTAMELYWSTGQRQQAINLFQRLTAVLAGDYGARPSPETVALYERFRGE